MYVFGLLDSAISLFVFADLHFPTPDVQHPRAGTTQQIEINVTTNDYSAESFISGSASFANNVVAHTDGSLQSHSPLSKTTVNKVWRLLVLIKQMEMGIYFLRAPMNTDIVVSTRCQANGKFQADEKLASSLRLSRLYLDCVVRSHDIS